MSAALKEELSNSEVATIVNLDFLVNPPADTSGEDKETWGSRSEYTQGKVNESTLLMSTMFLKVSGSIDRLVVE